MADDASRPPQSRENLRYPESARLTARARAVIPGGAHTYARGEDQYPEDAPSFIVRGEGCRVWSAEGAEFIEYGMGNRAVTLGYAHPEVIAAATRQMKLGTGFVRPAHIELDIAERMLALFPGRDLMVKFGKHGSDATSAAVKLARAATGRERIAICADHPFFSVDDWFIGSTPLNAGIPQAVRAITAKFRYNDIPDLERMFAENEGQIAAVIMEPITTDQPQPGYFTKLGEICARNGALLIIDEIITGFRMGFPGVHESLGAAPDLFTFSKAMGNGFSISALMGKREIMKLGGMDHDQPRAFLLSTTHGGETHAMAASMAVMDIYARDDVIGALQRQGARLRAGCDAAAKAAGLQDYFQVTGFDANLIYVTKDKAGERSQLFRTLFMEQMLSHGVLGPSFVISAAHDNDAVDRTIAAVEATLKVYARALEDGPEKHLLGRSVQPVWRRIAG